MKRFRLKSIYFKWIFLFTGLILISQGMTFLFALRYIMPDISANMQEKMQRKATFIQDMYRNGTPVSDNIFTLIGDTDINFYLFEIDTMPEEVSARYRDIISLDMLTRAANGEVVTAYTANWIRLPFCLMSLDDQIALLTTNLMGNELTFFFNAYQRSIMSSSLFASILIVTALIMVIRPIKKVTQATREVAGGNFNVKLETTSCDEVGELIRNFNIMTLALQKNEYLKKDFVSNVSHEFKTPITSIEGFARLMKNENATREEMNEYADIIIREAARLSNLSTNLLQLSLLDSDTIEPVKKPFHLDEQIREAILILERKWDEKNIEFDILMDEIVYKGHEALLSQVWINLIDNAIKFSPYKSIITIAAKRDQHTVIVTVADQGPGIRPEQAERIFDRFYKADKSRSKEGNGLGLSIVKHIVKLSKGTISVEPAGIKGTRFVVKLPD